MGRDPDYVEENATPGDDLQQLQDYVSHLEARIEQLEATIKTAQAENRI